MTHKNRLLIMTILSTLIIDSAMAATTSLKTTDLYEAPETWCKSLYIVVSGNNINSTNYYLENCAESSTKNTWYCNCETDEEFEVTFVNRKDDTSSYIIDIKADGNNVRRVVSANAFLSSSTNSSTSAATVTATTVSKKDYEAKIADLESKISSLETRLNSKITSLEGSSNTKIADAETRINNKILQIEAPAPQVNNIENNYDDTAIQAQINKVKNDAAREKESTSKFKTIVIVCLIIIVLLTIFAIVFSSWINWEREENR